MKKLCIRRDGSETFILEHSDACEQWVSCKLYKEDNPTNVLNWAKKQLISGQNPVDVINSYLCSTNAM